MPGFLMAKADARRIPLADKSVHCCVTSPPYWGLRDCGTEGQIGLEKSPEEYVAAMVEVFREVRRVLRDDGTLWLNIGDSYCNSDKWGGGGQNTGKQTVANDGSVPSWAVRKRKDRPEGMKPKDLVGIPWTLALALRADGWYLRSEIIWSKPNAMPESATDRPSKAHEQVFLLTKKPKYFYDSESAKDRRSDNPATLRRRTNMDNSAVGTAAMIGQAHGQSGNGANSKLQAGELRNSRTVWGISVASFKGAHFATMPVKLALRCIKAGTSAKGCCPDCGSPWVRVVEKTRVATRPGTDSKVHDVDLNAMTGLSGDITGYRDPRRRITTTTHLGWEPTCRCGNPETVPPVVFDPFSGAATTGVAADAVGCLYVGTDLNPEYLEIGRDRLNRPHSPAKSDKGDKGKPMPLFRKGGA